MWARLSVSTAVDGAFAFIAASFPLRDLQRWLRKRALEKMKVEETAKLESTRAGYLTQVVDGLSPDTVARLEEIGIVTFADLAYADPIRIMVKAGISLRHIIQWMDHAMLAIYALDYKQKLAENAITCSLDAKEFYETHFVKVGDDNVPVLRPDGTLSRGASPRGSGRRPGSAAARDLHESRGRPAGALSRKDVVHGLPG